MIARTWHARVAAGREAEYDRFAESQSLPMFRRLPGCLGVFFLGEGTQRRVLSLWRDAATIEALADNADYLAVSGRLSDSGILAAVGPVQLECARGAAFEPRA